MDIIEIINKKRIGKILSKEEIHYVIDGYVKGEIPDYQMSSLLMAIVLKGMTDQEIIGLTSEMLASGERLDLSRLGIVVDKHSTGGVGDKTTMIVGPMVAACGVNVAKMSGRGLGHTGGTIDKLESIPRFQVNREIDDFFAQVEKMKLAIVSQTNNLVPADKKIYALRDVTGTVESNALIASSIMSKKIASGAQKLVIDVKVGRGALIKKKKDAEKLANLMIKIGASHKMQVVCLLTNMDIPLGNCVGNALEVREAMEVLERHKPGHLTDLCLELSTYMVALGLGLSYKDAKDRVLEHWHNGDAYQKFLEFVREQHGDIQRLPESKSTYQIRSNKEGYLVDIDALALGKLSMHLGAGREKLTDEIDYGAGIILHKNINDYVKKGEVLMTLYTSRDLYIKDIQTNIFTFAEESRKDVKLIYKVIGNLTKNK